MRTVDNGKQEPLITEKIVQLKEDDWRGVLALIVVVGGLALIASTIFFAKESVDKVILFATNSMTFALAWYFKGREDANANK